MVKTRKRLGQHLLVSERIGSSIVESAPVSGRFIVEIGPGRGALTAPLLLRGFPVIAVEKDSSFVSFLRSRFPDTSLTLLEGDARDLGWLPLVGDSPYTVIANIPYYLTGSLIRLILTCPHPPSCMTLVLQKEVAERIAARDGKESLLSLSVSLFGTPRYVRTLSRRLFSPPPSVDSAVLTIDAISAPPARLQDSFFRIIRTAFHGKRKVVLKKFSAMPAVQSFLSEVGVDETVRAEDVSRETWLSAARRVLE